MTIGNPRDAVDENYDDNDAWFSEIADKAKKLADVDIVNLNHYHHGKILVL